MTIVTVGIDREKSVFAVHCVDATGKSVLLKPSVPRANMRFVPIKTVDQQGQLMVHRARQSDGQAGGLDGVRDA